MIAIGINASQLVAAARRLGKLNDRFPKILADGLNEGGDKTRTATQKALQEQTGAVKYKTVTSRVRTVRAHGGGLEYRLVVSPKKTQITEFKVTAKRGPGGGVTAYPWAAEHKFKRSFVTGKGAGRDFKARTTSKRFPVRKLYGPNLAKEAVVGLTASTFLATAERDVPAMVLKRLGKALGV